MVRLSHCSPATTWPHNRVAKVTLPEDSDAGRVSLVATEGAEMRKGRVLKVAAARDVLDKVVRAKVNADLEAVRTVMPPQ